MFRAELAQCSTDFLFRSEAAVTIQSACLLIELGYGCPPELLLLLETAGFRAVVGTVEDAEREPWACIVLSGRAETQDVVRDAVQRFTSRYCIPVLLAAGCAERIDLAALFQAGLADFIIP